MKPHTYSVYSSEFRDNYKDGNLAKISLMKNAYNEKTNINIGSFASSRNSKTQANLITPTTNTNNNNNNHHHHLIDANKITSLISPMCSPKNDLANPSSSHKTTIKYNIGELLLKNMADKKQSIQKTLQNPLNNNGPALSLLASRQSINETKPITKNISQGLLNKESNMISGMSSSTLKKAPLGNNTSNNAGLPHSVSHKRPIMKNENSSIQRRIDNCQIENSLGIENHLIENSPNRQTNDYKITLGSKAHKEEDYFRKQYQSYSPPNHANLEKKYEIKRNLSKGSGDIFFQKDIHQLNRDYMSTLHDDPFEKESYSSGGLTLISTTATGDPYSKKGELRINLNRERTISPSIETIIHSTSKDKLSYGLSSTKEGSRDKSKRIVYDFESFDDASLTKDKLRDKKSLDYNEAKYKSLKLNEFNQFNNKDEEDLYTNKDEENIKLFQKNSYMGSSITSNDKIPNIFSTYAAYKECREGSKVEKTTMLKIPDKMSFDLGMQNGIPSPKNYVPVKNGHRLSDDIRKSLQLNADTWNSDWNKIRDLQQKVPSQNFLGEKVPSRLLEEENSESNKNFDNLRFLNKTGSMQLIKNNYKLAIEKVYAETSKNKDAKKFELSSKIADDLKQNQKDIIAYNSTHGAMELRNYEAPREKPEIRVKPPYIESQILNKQDEQNNVNLIVKQKKLQNDGDQTSNEGNIKKVFPDSIPDGNQLKVFKYGNDNRGMMMTKAYEKIREMLEMHCIKERTWQEEKDMLQKNFMRLEKEWKDEKAFLVNKLENLERKLNEYDNKKK